MTESERKFEEVQRIRVSEDGFAEGSHAHQFQREERAKKTATQSHKDRVAEYNAKLERLSEHHDMPKVSLGMCARQYVELIIVDWSRIIHVVNQYASISDTQTQPGHLLNSSTSLQSIVILLVLDRRAISVMS
jgi:hypothetical protein